jgi:hypothetical protein
MNPSKWDTIREFRETAEWNRGYAQLVNCDEARDDHRVMAARFDHIADLLNDEVKVTAKLVKMLEQACWNAITVDEINDVRAELGLPSIAR